MSDDDQAEPNPEYLIWGERRFFPTSLFTLCSGDASVEPSEVDSGDIKVPSFFSSFFATKTGRNNRYKYKCCVSTVPIKYRAFVSGQYCTKFEPVVLVSPSIKEEPGGYLGLALEVYACAVLNRDVYAALFRSVARGEGESILFDIHLARERCALCGVRAVNTEHLNDMLLCTECVASTRKFFKVPPSCLRNLGFPMFHTGIVQLMTLEMSAAPRTRALWFEFVPGTIVSYLRIPGAELLVMINFREYKYRFPSFGRASSNLKHYSFDACPVRAFYAFGNGMSDDDDARACCGTTAELEDLFSGMAEFQFVRDAVHRLGFQINQRARTWLTEIPSLRKQCLIKVLSRVDWGVEPRPPSAEEGFMNGIHAEEHLLVKFCWRSMHFRHYFHAFIQHLSCRVAINHPRMSYFRFGTAHCEYEPSVL